MLKTKFSLKPNFSACLKISAFSLPKYGIRKKAIRLNHKVDKKISKYPNFLKPLIINQIPNPITKNELVILQVKIKKVFKNISHEAFISFVFNETKISKTIGNAITSG